MNLKETKSIVLFLVGLIIAGVTFWVWIDVVFLSETERTVVWWEQAIAVGLFSLGVFMMAPEQFKGWFATVGDVIPKFGKKGGSS